ncbi:hypothetical protein ABZ543_12890 [Streptomyces roseifaciens]
MHRRPTDPDDALDITKTVLAGLHCSSTPVPAPERPLPSGTGRRLTRRTKTVDYSPDSLRGLCDYFMSACPDPTWHALERGNQAALRVALSELRHSGMTPAKVRALIDLFFQRQGDQPPHRTYVGDFTKQRLDLIRELVRTGTAKTDADYSSWNAAYQTPDSEQNAYAASWEGR